jgi:outer membrane receptor for ferrienterochelin and colicins
MWPLVIASLLAQTDAGVDERPDPSRATVVTGSRGERRAGDAVVPTEVITRQQIESLGVRDLPQLLQQHPGVEMVYTSRGTGLRLQGMDPEYVLILVDGQRVAGRSGSFTDISRFSLRDIERVEIIKGPAAALYGADAIGGVINLITRRPTKVFEGSAGGMFGTLLEADIRGYAGSKLGPFELRAGGGYRTRNPYDWDKSDPATSGAGLKRADGDLEVAYAPNEDLRVWARTQYIFTDLNGVDINTSGALFDHYQRTEAFDTWLGYRQRFNGVTTATLRGHFGLFKDQLLVDQRGSKALDEYSVNLTRFYEAVAQVEHRVDNHIISGGVEGYFERLNSTRIDPNIVQRGRVGIFLQDEWVVTNGSGPKLTLSTGFRADVDTQFGWAPSPRIALKVDPIPELTLRASFGMGFRPPSFSELYLRFSNAGVGYIVQGNANLKAEKSISANISADWRLPLQGWVLSASAWHTGVTNLINVSASGMPNPDDPVLFGYENVADAYTQGGEISLRTRISRGTYLDVSYMGLDARDVTRNRPLEGRSNHLVNATLTAKYSPFGLELVVRGTYHSPRPYYLGAAAGYANVLGLGPEQTVMAAGYFDLEAQLSYTWRWFRVFVNGYNLLNSGDQNYNPRPPRGVIGGLQVDI